MPKPDSRSRKSCEKEPIPLALRHRGLICQRVLRWYRFLPATVRCWYDVEDMMNDALLHVHRRAPRYDPSLAMESTWVYHVADNYCMGVLNHHRARKYTECETVEMTEIVSGRCAAADSTELRESKDAVERVIEAGSDAIQEFLEKLFNGGRITAVPYHELLEAARRAGATFADFNRVYKSVVD